MRSVLVPTNLLMVGDVVVCEGIRWTVQGLKVNGPGYIEVEMMELASPNRGMTITDGACRRLDPFGGSCLTWRVVEDLP